MRLILFLLIVSLHFSVQGHFQQRLEHYIQDKRVPNATQMRFYTYLSLAKEEAEFILNDIGSVDPVVKRVVETFFPDFDDFEGFESDQFSENVATQVWDDCLKKQLQKED